MNTKVEPKRLVKNFAREKNEIAEHCLEEDHNFNWDQKKAVDRERKLIHSPENQRNYTLFEES